MNTLRSPWFLLLATVILAWGVYAGGKPPAPLPASAPEQLFSAGRAETWLQALYRDGQPHVTGSARNAAQRDQIVSALQGFGYRPEVQSLFHCNARFGACSPVENIVAVRQGRQQGSAILLTAHYDSAWAGPGVADDGAGVAAVLEIARMLSLSPEFEHEVIFLLTDGEEQGLIGADAFLRHPLFTSVRAVINLEARGAAGASTMFETGDRNRGVIRMLANSLDRPVANSLAYEVYRRMPNDTDFSVFRVGGLPGVNFAFTGRASLYHSRIDDLAHLERASLQHHGQNAWSMLRALDERNLDRLPSAEDAVYVDLFGKKLLQYPVSSAVGLAVVLSVMVLVGIRRAFRDSVRFGQVLLTLLAMVALAAAMLGSGWLLSWPLGRWVDISPLEHPFPAAGRASLLLAAAGSIVVVLKFLAPRVTTGSILAGVWGLFILLAVVLASAMPAAGFLTNLPLLGFALGLVPDGFRWRKQPRLLYASLCGYLAAAYVGFYLFLQLDVVLNFRHGMLKMLPLIWPAIALLPLLRWCVDARRPGPWFYRSVLILVAAGCVAQQFLPAYTPDTPRDMSLMVRQEAGQPQARLVLESVLGAPDPVFAGKHGFTPVELVGIDGEPETVLARNIDAIELPPVGITRSAAVSGADAGADRRQRVDLQVPEQVQQLVVSVPDHARLDAARVNELLAFDAALQPGKNIQRHRLTINHPPAGLLHLELEFASPDKGGDLVVAARYELPPEVLAPYLSDWPDDAQPAFLGPRVLQLYRIPWTADW